MHAHQKCHLPMRDSLGRSLILIAVVLGPAVGVFKCANANPPAGSMPAIVCLHTEWLPQKSEKSVVPTAIVRELGRQAILIAARDELGLTTRDETLGETFPDTVTEQKQDLAVKVRGYRNGLARVELTLASADELGTNFSKQTKFDPDRMKKLAHRFEEMSRDELPARLRELGFAGKVLLASEANLPPDSVEGQLLEMNFVSQFAAVRAAHAAIADKGQSRAWLGVLTRGYAHLSMMTQHHWKSDSQAFAARALLYGERLANSNPDDPWSRAHLAYAQAIVGLHSAALSELDEIDKLRKSAAEPASLPGWFDLIRPFCQFEREPVAAIINRGRNLRELAQRLSFEQNRGFGDDRWRFESAKQTIALCPEEYGVYAELTHDTPLGVGRTGAYAAPAALAKYLPPRIASLSDLPDAVRNAANGIAANKNDAGNQPLKPAEEDDAVLDEHSAVVTSSIVQALRNAAGSDTNEPSWSVLGELIFEEQFVEAANYLSISMNATESSHAASVKAILPTVAGHRYAPHIESYAFNARTQGGQLNKTLGEMEIVDPRGNMEPMMVREWRATGTRKDVENLGANASEFAFRHCGMTYPELLESQTHVAETWWTHVAKWQREERIRDFSNTSPRSPQVLRLAMACVEKPTYEEARKWEGEAGEDPKAFIRLAEIYAKLEWFDDATRCFERSIELSPDIDAFIGLANAHRANRQEEMWQPTLERYLKIEDLGLGHASIHHLIANDLMAKNKWKEAEPHAVDAARTYSAWGLHDAADVYEGLGKLDESEKFIRAMSENYPTGSGDEWYFWCLRNGRGDLEASRKPAEAYFAMPNPRDDQKRRELTVIYKTSQGDLGGAMEHARWLFEKHDTKEAVMPARAFYAFQMVFLARDLKDAGSEKTPLNSGRRAGNLMKDKSPDLSEVVEFTWSLLDGKKPSDKERSDMDAHLNAETVTNVQRGAFEYLIGRGLEANGDTRHAKEYYRRAVTRFRANPDAATLAGIRLHTSKQK